MDPLGTYVADRPPCLFKFGLVFPRRAVPLRPWPKNWHALLQVAQHWASENHEEWVIYCDDEERATDGSGGNEEYQRLVADTLEPPPCGLVFAMGKPWPMLFTPVLQQQAVPMSSVANEFLTPSVRRVGLDHSAWLGRALDRLKECQCRRVAFLTHDASRERREMFTSAASARGLKVEPFAIQANPMRDVRDVEGTRQCIYMMGMLGPHLRPDGLIVTDDSLVESAAAGLAAAGLRVPRDIEVVAHWNFPLIPPADARFHWLGFDAEEVLKACRASLQYPHTQRRDRPAGTIPPRFSGELLR